MPDGRYAPSPTGELHLGNLRTALLAWAFARSSGGRFLLRFEDLDAGASRPEHEERQRRDLAALGLDWDGAPVRQSERRHLHNEAVERLVAADVVYPCFCTRREIREATRAPHGDLPDGAYPGTCRDLDAAGRRSRAATGRRPALRLRGEGRRRGFVDRVLGPVEGVVPDVVVRRGDGTPAYQLAVVVDDHDQGVEEVVRGDDLAPSTPSQLLVAEVLGVPSPTYAHVPLALGPDGRRLAKRDGAVTLADLSTRGIGAADVLGILAESLGLADRAERIDTAELLVRFDPDRLPTDPWIVRPDQLSSPASRSPPS
ncbi:MAG: tRNA glutamyl-Q(34) synthetase GluQRS [Actinomycetota bacterium]